LSAPHPERWGKSMKNHQLAMAKNVAILKSHLLKKQQVRLLLASILASMKKEVRK
jgi:hypothetical protein